MANELKPCPNPWCPHKIVSVESMSRGPAYVACACGVRGPACGWDVGEEAARNEAIVAWNHRAPSPAFVAMREALETAKKQIEKSEFWWMDCPDRGGFDLEQIDAALALADAETK